MKQTTTIDITQSFGQKLVDRCIDNNNETDIRKAGIFDLCDALSGKDNSKFSKEQADAELSRRGM